MSTVLEHRATQPSGPTGADADPSIVASGSPSLLDRSSIKVDAMVTIEGVSEAEWRELAPDNQVCEYWDGVIYMPPPASLEHKDDVGFWFFLLSGYVEQRGLGRVVLGPGFLSL